MGIRERQSQTGLHGFNPRKWKDGVAINEEEKIIEACLGYVCWEEGEKSGAQVEYVEFEMALRLSGGNVDQAVGNTVWGLGRFEVKI